jgi:hypothetical protein
MFCWILIEELLVARYQEVVEWSGFRRRNLLFQSMINS